MPSPSHNTPGSTTALCINRKYQATSATTKRSRFIVTLRQINRLVPTLEYNFIFGDLTSLESNIFETTLTGLKKGEVPDDADTVLVSVERAEDATVDGGSSSSAQTSSEAPLGRGSDEAGAVTETSTVGRETEGDGDLFTAGADSVSVSPRSDASHATFAAFSASGAFGSVADAEAAAKKESAVPVKSPLPSSFSSKASCSKTTSSDDSSTS